jgi:hypothetical protein
LWRSWVLPVAFTLGTAGMGAAADEVYFSAIHDVDAALVAKIRAERVRIDMSIWLLTERSISIALVERVRAGVPVRLIGDRVSIFESDPLTRREFYWLASQGVPIRLRSHPTWYPEINHWKATILVGQNTVAFGSANYTPFELRPASPDNYKDETVLFTDDPAIVNAFKTQFDRMWNDTTPEPGSQIRNPPFLRNWATACAAESSCADFTTLYPDPLPMAISTARLEPDHPLPPEIIWEQGARFNNRLVDEIQRESGRVDATIFRLTVESVANAFLNRHQAGVPVRLIIEPSQYATTLWPEYWLTHAYIDRLWAAGVRIKQRRHEGLTHMKLLVTSSIATIGSSNIAAFWQRDHNYFAPAATKSAIYLALRNRFDAMWNDEDGFAAFTPSPPHAASLVSPSGGAQVAGAPTLVWNRAPFAVGYHVLLGTSPDALEHVGSVPAVLTPNPPATYSWTAPAILTAGTTYYWRVVSYTYANLTAASATRSFTTPEAPTELWWHHQRSDGVAVWQMDANRLVQSFAVSGPQINDGGWVLRGAGDFSGDGAADLLWHHPSLGLLSVWLMDGSRYLGPGMLTPNTVSDRSWGIGAVADFNRDGHVDILWRHGVDGRLVVWYMNRLTWVRSVAVQLPDVPDRNWAIVGAGDFNEDGAPDILWQHQLSRNAVAWLVRDATVTAAWALSPSTVDDKRWKAVAVLDLNRDGHSDVIWQHETSGMVVVWYMHRNTWVASAVLSGSPLTDLDWRLVSAN